MVMTRSQSKQGTEVKRPKLHYDFLKGVAKKLMALRKFDMEGENRWWVDWSLEESPQFKFMVSIFVLPIDWYLFYAHHFQLISKACRGPMVRQFGMTVYYVKLEGGRAWFYALTEVRSCCMLLTIRVHTC